MRVLTTRRGDGEGDLLDGGLLLTVQGESIIMSLSKIEKAWSTYAISPGRKQNENPAFGLELNQRLVEFGRRRRRSTGEFLQIRWVSRRRREEEAIGDDFFFFRTREDFMDELGGDSRRSTAKGGSIAPRGNGRNRRGRIEAFPIRGAWEARKTMAELEGGETEVHGGEKKKEGGRVVPGSKSLARPDPAQS
ncbi:hypothetical protein NL676_018069 [Syzygium grande]|nr:hypothetical protein NL676_018069 [Syzygium grande]